MSSGFSGFFDDQPVLTWRFTLPGGDLKVYDDPGFAAPDNWLSAMAAVTRDLRCRQYGREVNVEWLMWELSVYDDWAVMIGGRARGLGGFGLRREDFTLETPFVEAAVWIADTVQTELAGYEFIQWPSSGRRMLNPQLVDGKAVWIDTRSGEVVAAIGVLCGAR